MLRSTELDVRTRFYTLAALVWPSVLQVREKTERRAYERYANRAAAVGSNFGHDAFDWLEEERRQLHDLVLTQAEFVVTNLYTHDNGDIDLNLFFEDMMALVQILAYHRWEMNGSLPCTEQVDWHDARSCLLEAVRKALANRIWQNEGRPDGRASEHWNQASHGLVSALADRCWRREGCPQGEANRTRIWLATERWLFSECKDGLWCRKCHAGHAA